MNPIRLAGLALVASALMAGCASDVKLDNKPAPVETRSPISANSSGVSGTATPAPAPAPIASVDANSMTSAAELAHVIYFDYDSFAVKDEFRSVIEAQAKALTAERQKKLSVEGNTDERGGSEYNLALGQKRAEAVAKALKLLGVNDAQLEAVSFGKERPAAQGHDEAAWAKNRRVELNKR